MTSVGKCSDLRLQMRRSLAVARPDLFSPYHAIRAKVPSVGQSRPPLIIPNTDVSSVVDQASFAFQPQPCLDEDFVGHHPLRFCAQCGVSEFRPYIWVTFDY
jgi:hypothetical protein